MPLPLTFIASGIWLPAALARPDSMPPLEARRAFYATKYLSDLFTMDAMAVLTSNTREANPTMVSKLIRPRDWRNDDWTEGLLHPRTVDGILMVTADDDGHPNLVYSLRADCDGDDVESILDLAGADYGSTCAIGWVWDYSNHGWQRDTGMDLG